MSNASLAAISAAATRIAAGHTSPCACPSVDPESSTRAVFRAERGVCPRDCSDQWWSADRLNQVRDRRCAVIKLTTPQQNLRALLTRRRSRQNSHLRRRKTYPSPRPRKQLHLSWTCKLGQTLGRSEARCTALRLRGARRGESSRPRAPRSVAMRPVRKHRARRSWQFR